MFQRCVETTFDHQFFSGIFFPSKSFRQNRGLDLEKLCAQLGQSERGAQGELLRAQEREQLSRVT